MEDQKNQEKGTKLDTETLKNNQQKEKEQQQQQQQQQQ